MEQIVRYIKKYKFSGTTANFKPIPLDDYSWLVWKTDPENLHWQSPSSTAEYILTPSFKIYRRAKEWGKVGDFGCHWTIDGRESSNGFEVGFCHIDNFIKNVEGTVGEYYRKMVVNQVIAHKDERGVIMDFAFEDSAVCLTVPSWLKDWPIDHVNAGDILFVRGRLGNEDYMLATFDAVDDMVWVKKNWATTKH